MLLEKIERTLEGLNGVVLIDVDDAIHCCWEKTHPEYWILQKLGETAQRMGIPLFIDKGRGILEDYEAINKEDITKNWIHIPRFNYEASAEIIERNLGIPRDQTYLGFGGTYAEYCVRRFLFALCHQKIIPEVQSDCLIMPLTEISIEKQFAKGKLLYELTENRYVSLFFDRAIKQSLEDHCEAIFGPIMHD